MKNGLLFLKWCWTITVYIYCSFSFWLGMARGQQKIQSQQKAAEKAAKAKKQQGHSATDQKKAALAALVHVCAVCKVIQVNLNIFSMFIHFFFHVFSHKCQIRKLTNNILRTNIPRIHCLMIWRMLLLNLSWGIWIKLWSWLFVFLKLSNF